MTPLSFVTDIADDSYNTPAGEVVASLNKPIKILSGSGEEWEVLSYYYDKKTGCMCLDIERTES